MVQQFAKYVQIVAYYYNSSPQCVDKSDIRITYSVAGGQAKRAEPVETFDESKATDDVYFTVDNYCVTIYTKHFTKFRYYI
jgi:hypothetical protein